MGKDYYKILGVDKNAGADEIKKAFRKKAHEFHPDKAGGDEAKFKEANEAYQVLSDTKKRSQYDQYGSAFEHGQSQGGFSGFGDFRDFSGFTNGFNVNAEDLGDIFGGIGDMFGFGGGQQRSRSRRGNDIETVLTIDFHEAVFGTEKEIGLRKKVKCGHCHGNAAEPGTKIETCKTCGGSGRVTRVQRTILGNMQVQTACTACGGEGKSYAQKCSKCAGTGVVFEVVNLRVRIPAGIDQGENIRLSGEGEAGERGAAAGDLYLRINVRPDKRFERVGSDIKSSATITFAQAVLGDKIDIETVDGPVKLKIPAGTRSGSVFKLKGRGVSRLRSSGRGDHYAEVIIDIPKNLTKKQKELLKEMEL